MEGRGEEHCMVGSVVQCSAEQGSILQGRTLLYNFESSVVTTAIQKLHCKVNFGNIGVEMVTFLAGKYSQKGGATLQLS